MTGFEGLESYEDKFGPPKTRRFDMSGDSEAKRERHYYRTARPGPGEMLAPVRINDRTPEGDPHPAAIEIADGQIIEITHDLAQAVADAAEPGVV